MTFSNHPLSWRGAGSNRRRQDFQSCALPTELQSQLQYYFFIFYKKNGGSDEI